MRRSILVVVLMITTQVLRAQQDPLFSQNMFNHMTVNPAFAGEQGRWMISGIYRNQWQSMEGAPETYAFNIDAPLKIKRMDGGIGFNLMNDKAGMLSTMHLMLNYSYKVRLNFGVLSLGTKLGIVNTKIDGEYYIPDGNASDDPALNQESVSKSMFDMGLGVFLTGNKFYSGIAISHITKPKMKVGQTGEFFFGRHLCVTGGYTVEISPKFDVQPSVFMNTDFISSQFNMNANLVFNKMIWGGVSYRYQEAVIFMGGMELKNGIMVGYSYDWNMGSVGRYIGGSHEVTIAYGFGVRVAKKQKIYKSVRFL